MRRIVALVIVIAVVAWVFSIVLRPNQVDPARVKQWQKHTSKMQRKLVIDRFPEGARHFPASFGSEDEVVPPDAEPQAATWRELSSFEWRPGVVLPDNIRELDGKYVRIHGHILPAEERSPLTEFLFIPSYLGCYFKRNLSLSDMIQVRIKGEPVKFVEFGILISGRLHVGLESVNGKPSSIYRMTVTRVEHPDMLRGGHEHDEHEGEDGHEGHDEHEDGDEVEDEVEDEAQPEKGGEPEHEDEPEHDKGHESE